MTALPSLAALWLNSLALFALGLLAHRRIATTDTQAGLGFVRYVGLLCGAVGVLGVPLTTAANPYLSNVSLLHGVALSAGTVVLSLGIGHLGWTALGPETQ